MRTVLRRNLSRALREATLWPSVLAMGRSDRLAFLPGEHRSGASLLRAYMISDALNEMGWNSVVVPPHLGIRQRKRILKAVDPDFVIVQKCRHPLNRLEFLADYRIILDVDDADFLDPCLTAPMETMARHAVGVISGSRFISKWARQFNEATEIIWTGSKPSGGERPLHSHRQPIVTWAQAAPLDYQQEFSFIREIILSAWSRGSRFKFRLYGWKDDDNHKTLKPLREMGIPLETLSPMNYDAFLNSLRDVSVGLSLAATAEQSSYSSGKSFGKILAYLDAKVPVICNDAADHSLFFDRTCGVIAGDVQRWVDELCHLLANPRDRQILADTAFERFSERLSIHEAAKRTSSFLRKRQLSL